MTQTIAEDVMIGTFIFTLLVLISAIAIIGFAFLYEIHPLLPVVIALVWVGTVGYLVQTNPHNDVDLQEWYR